MTIKIIKEGKLPRDRQYLFHCYNCETEFTATEEDGKRFIQRDGYYVAVNCPLCFYSCTYTVETT